MEDLELSKASASTALYWTRWISTRSTWHEAMQKFGHDVSFELARSQIGKGGDKLIPEFPLAEEQKDHGKELEE